MGYRNFVNSNSTQTLTVNPDSGYNAMGSVVINYRKRNTDQYIYISNTASSSTSGGVNVAKFKYRLPNDDNSTTSGHIVTQIRLDPDSSYNYFALNTIFCYMRVQHITITTNGTYYPTDDTTVIKKIVVNVPTQTINNYDYGTIITNGQYTIPSGYTGISNLNINVQPNKSIYVMKFVCNYQDGSGMYTRYIFMRSFSSSFYGPSSISYNRVVVQLIPGDNGIIFYNTSNLGSTSMDNPLPVGGLNGYYYYTVSSVYSNMNSNNYKYKISFFSKENYNNNLLDDQYSIFNYESGLSSPDVYKGINSTIYGASLDIS